MTSHKTAFFYPTRDEWFPKLLEQWKATTNSRLAIPFYNHTVRALPVDQNAVFWMYLYYSKAQTEDVNLAGTVPYRVRVVHHQEDEGVTDRGFQHPDTFVEPINYDNARTWFVIDCVEEICRVDGSALGLADFEHAEGKSLQMAIIAAVAPANRKPGLLIKARHMLEIQD
jgi:hypothetical protein